MRLRIRVRKWLHILPRQPGVWAMTDANSVCEVRLSITEGVCKLSVASIGYVGFRSRWFPVCVCGGEQCGTIGMVGWGGAGFSGLSGGCDEGGWWTGGCEGMRGAACVLWAF